MITITKGQILKDNPELEVVSPSGEYEDVDIIQCAYIGDETPICGFEARYVEQGNIIYR